MAKTSNKIKFIKFLPLAVVAIITLMQFQNCGQFETLEKSELDLASVDVTIMHPDEDHSPPAEAYEKLTTNYQPTLADKYFLIKHFENIFGPSSKTYIDTTNLALNRTEFGSPCSIYENYKYQSGTNILNANTTETCALQGSSDYLSANMMANTSVTHQARIATLCANLTVNSTTFNHMLGQIKPSPSGMALPLPTEGSVQKLIQLFYRNNEPVDLELVQALQILINPTAPTISEWQNAAYVVCTSSHWQAL